MVGYKGLVITDHCDSSNLEELLNRVKRFCETAAENFAGLKILPGCELTHVPPSRIPKLVEDARDLGAALVLVHGETVVEPVAPGTNSAAIGSGADVLAHPGLISQTDVQLAAKNGVRLEISGRKGHSLTNGHVAKRALHHGTRLSFGSDGHAPGDYPGEEMAINILKGAGLTQGQADEVLAANAEFFGPA